jgi:hypothetical protein
VVVVLLLGSTSRLRAEAAMHQHLVNDQCMR